LWEKGYLPNRNSGDGDGFAEGEWIHNNDCVHHLDSGLQIVEVIDTWNWSYL